jgi:hypothetical protein
VTVQDLIQRFGLTEESESTQLPDGVELDVNINLVLYMKIFSLNPGIKLVLPAELTLDVGSKENFGKSAEYPSPRT